MYSMSHQPASTSLNGNGLSTGMMDGSGTINPAALNSSALAGPTQAIASQSSPRGVKRSRSPGEYGDGFGGIKEEDDRQKKRNRPKGSAESPSQRASQPPQHASAGPVRTPQLKAQSLPQTSPTQSSPPKSTPTKGAVLKALPTVRDHTTDQLGPEGDEYIPREYDDAGEKKVSPTGEPLGGRTYRCRTFFVQGRSNKLFMLATECARVLGYRDSYLLFNKNRSLYKIIASQPEKDDLIAQDVLPYSYRSRQIAIVTARSMFRQFGSRLIEDGRRVKDDYWEGKARKQGFTEEDAAGEKRPGGAKQRQAAAAEASTASGLTALPHGEIIYSNGPTSHLDGHGLAINPTTLAPLPMIHPPPTMDEHLRRDYSNIQRPRHEISGPPYVDRTVPSSAAEILNQSAQAAEYNKNFNAQGKLRAEYQQENWKRPHEIPASPQQQAALENTNNSSLGGQNTHSPHAPTQPSTAANPQSMARPQQQYPQSYSQQPHAGGTMPSQMAPMQSPLGRDPMHHRNSTMGMGGPSSQGQPSPYGYPTPGNMFPPPPSPYNPQHMQYGQQSQQQSPHPQQSQLHQSPQMNPGNLHAGMSPGFPPGAMGGGRYQMPQNPYQQSPNHQQPYMGQSTSAQQPGMQGWAPPPQQHSQQPGWQQF